MCCAVTVLTRYRILNRTSRSAALPYPEQYRRHPCGALAQSITVTTIEQVYGTDAGLLTCVLAIH